MSWLVTAKQYIPAVIGEEFGGGYFAGYISHTADGNPTHALIVAPRATGATGTDYTLTTNLAFKTANTDTSGTASIFDGVANTAAIVAAGIADHPAAGFCVNLSIGGFTDWYLPSQTELDIAYFNLKPSTAGNTVGAGINQHSVPKRNTPYTSNYPQQTSLSEFATTTQGFTNNLHWSSTTASAIRASTVNFSNGDLQTGAFFQLKDTLNRVRAFRRIAL